MNFKKDKALVLAALKSKWFYIGSDYYLYVDTTGVDPSGGVDISFVDNRMRFPLVAGIDVMEGYAFGSDASSVLVYETFASVDITTTAAVVEVDKLIPTITFPTVLNNAQNLVLNAYKVSGKIEWDDIAAVAAYATGEAHSVKLTVVTVTGITLDQVIWDKTIS